MDSVLIPFFLILTCMGSDGAKKAATEAYGKQSGIERMLDDWQRRELSPELRARTGEAFFVMKMVSEKKLTLEWRF